MDTHCLVQCAADRRPHVFPEPPSLPIADQKISTAFSTYFYHPSLLSCSSGFELLSSLFPSNGQVARKGEVELRKNSQRGSYGLGSLKSNQCPSECSRRGSRTQYHRPCMFFCQKCCRKCLCVPPGFYGNKQLCSCYNNWKTKRRGPKCP